MNEQPIDLWSPAVRALMSARMHLAAGDADGVASRAYYAAFHAMSAVEMQAGRVHKKHTGLEAAIHKELVRTGRVREDLGAAYSSLFVLRKRGDYGGRARITLEDAARAIAMTEMILREVRRISTIPLPDFET